MKTIKNLKNKNLSRNIGLNTSNCINSNQLCNMRKFFIILILSIGFAISYGQNEKMCGVSGWKSDNFSFNEKVIYDSTSVIYIPIKLKEENIKYINNSVIIDTKSLFVNRYCGKNGTIITKNLEIYSDYIESEDFAFDKINKQVVVYRQIKWNRFSIASCDFLEKFYNINLELTKLKETELNELKNNITLFIIGKPILPFIKNGEFKKYPTIINKTLLYYIDNTLILNVKEAYICNKKTGKIYKKINI